MARHTIVSNACRNLLHSNVLTRGQKGQEGYGHLPLCQCMVAKRPHVKNAPICMHSRQLVPIQGTCYMLQDFNNLSKEATGVMMGHNSRIRAWEEAHLSNYTSQAQPAYHHRASAVIA